METSVRLYFAKKAAREIKKEIETVKLDELKILAEAGISIIQTYLNSRSPQEKTRIRRDFNALVQMGVTPDMVLTELLKQMPELAPAMEGKEGYKQSEIKNLELFLGK
jgi:hypothetical protein